MSDTPETQEAVERWRQGKINIFDEMARLERERDKAQATLKDANESVVAFGVLWAAQYAADRGLPKGHLHPKHYDILHKAGARMNDFTRADLQEAAK